MTRIELLINDLRSAAEPYSVRAAASAAGIPPSSLHQLLRDGVEGNGTLRNIRDLELGCAQLRAKSAPMHEKVENMVNGAAE